MPEPGPERILNPKELQGVLFVKIPGGEKRIPAVSQADEIDRLDERMGHKVALDLRVGEALGRYHSLLTAKVSDLDHADRMGEKREGVDVGFRARWSDFPEFVDGFKPSNLRSLSARLKLDPWYKELVAKNSLFMKYVSWSCRDLASVTGFSADYSITGAGRLDVNKFHVNRTLLSQDEVTKGMATDARAGFEWNFFRFEDKKRFPNNWMNLSVVSPQTLPKAVKDEPLLSRLITDVGKMATGSTHLGIKFGDPTYLFTYNEFAKVQNGRLANSVQFVFDESENKFLRKFPIFSDPFDYFPKNWSSTCSSEMQEKIRQTQIMRRPDLEIGEFMDVLNGMLSFIPVVEDTQANSFD